MKTTFPSALGALLAAASGLMACGPVAAAAGGSVVATTNYVFQGLSHSDQNPAVQADAHLKTAGGWFGGLWGSFVPGQADYASESELNLYLGRTWAFNQDWTGSLHYARYFYPDGRPYVQVFYDEYDEAQLTLNFQTRLTLSFAVASDVLRYSQHTHALNRGRQISYEASFRQPLWRSLNLTLGVGHYDLSDIFQGSYWAWSGGVELGLRGLQLSLSRFGTDDAAWRMFGPQTANARWALTAAWRF